MVLFSIAARLRAHWIGKGTVVAHLNISRFCPSSYQVPKKDRCIHAHIWIRELQVKLERGGRRNKSARSDPREPGLSPNRDVLMSHWISCCRVWLYKLIVKYLSDFFFLVSKTAPSLYKQNVRSSSCCRCRCSSCCSSRCEILLCHGCPPL